MVAHQAVGTAVGSVVEEAGVAAVMVKEAMVVLRLQLQAGADTTEEEEVVVATVVATVVVTVVGLVDMVVPLDILLPMAAVVTATIRVRMDRPPAGILPTADFSHSHGDTGTKAASLCDDVPMLTCCECASNARQSQHKTYRTRTQLARHVKCWDLDFCGEGQWLGKFRRLFRQLENLKRGHSKSFRAKGHEGAGEEGRAAGGGVRVPKRALIDKQGGYSSVTREACATDVWRTASMQRIRI